MTPASFEDIATQLVETDRLRAQFQARDIAERLAQGPTAYTLDQARSAMRARDALVKELLRTAQ